MFEQGIIPPDLDNILNDLKNSIFANLNCVQIGKIEKVNNNQTVEIQIQVKRRIKGLETVNYPLLVDCPLMVMQGGGAFLEFPVKKGDYCIVLFNDRNIDTWWDTANIKEPLTKRKHSLSDGFALVGINPKTSTLGLSGDKVGLKAVGYDIEITTDKNIIFDNGEDNAVRYNSLNTGLTSQDASINEELTKLTTTINAMVTAFSSLGITIPPYTQGSVSTDITGSKIEEIKVP